MNGSAGEFQELQRRLRENWRKYEMPCIAAAIRGPIFHLGLVELAFDPERKKEDPLLFRLTELGRAVICDAFRPIPRRKADSPSPVTDKGCWVVQPNFDVIVYLDRASASNLALIERVAERGSAQGPTALYHLTRDSIYLALESGLELDYLIETLALGSEHPLPNNVKRSIEDWASRREQFTIYTLTDTLELADSKERDAALASKDFQGTPIGDRFVLPKQRSMAGTRVKAYRRTIDYTESPAQCVTVMEDGVLEIDPARADLLVRSELSCWSELDSSDGNRWRITRSSIQNAVSSGWSAETILEALLDRSELDVPELLGIAICSWSEADSEIESAAITSGLILQVVNDEAAEAIEHSEIFQAFFKARLGPNTFLVKRERAKELKGKLEEFGISVGKDLLRLLDSL